jgi:voltage-gated potassium channel
LFSRLFKIFYSHISRLTWEMVLLLVALHFAVALVGLRLFESGEMVDDTANFFYFYVTTVMTVGYGDLSPKTEAGRVFTAIWLQPGGILLFTMVIARFAQWLGKSWRARMRGEVSYEDLEGHIVIIGWGQRTSRMIDELIGDRRREPREIVLCARQEIENPLPEKVKFVREASLATPTMMQRAGVPNAHSVIVLAQDDSETLAAALAVSAANRSAHLVAYFGEDSYAALLRAHCPRAEAITSIHAELLVRAASDPGASRVVLDLLSTHQAPFQISVRVPDSAPAAPYFDWLTRLKREHNATLIGVATDTHAGHVDLNAAMDRMVKPGEILYLIAPERIHAADIDWSRGS